MLVRTVGMEARGYASARAFLDDTDPGLSDCIVLDVRMPGLSGLELQQRLATSGAATPIIFVSGHGDIPMAVQAMRNGAIDFLQKPFSEQALLDRINGAIRIAREARRVQAQRDVWMMRYEHLTAREQEVLKNILAGLQNKQIAAELGISSRTVEQHRSQVMRKMGVRTVAELLAAVGSVMDSTPDSFPPKYPDR